MSLVRADPVLGRHLFLAEGNGAARRYRREDGLERALADAIAALEPVFRMDEVDVSLGTLDEYGQAESEAVVRLAGDEPWPERIAVAVNGTVGAIRAGVPDGAAPGAEASFACEDGFLRRATVTAAPALGDVATVWIEGGAMMSTRVRGRIDGHAHLELQLGTSLHDRPDPRDPAWIVEGASIAAWRAASQPLLAAIDRALAAAGWSRC